MYCVIAGIELVDLGFIVIHYNFIYVYNCMYVTIHMLNLTNDCLHHHLLHTVKVFFKLSVQTDHCTNSFLSQPLPNVPDCFKMFSIVPNHSTLYPGEKAQAVTIAFRPQGEVVLVDQAILKCQVIDVHVGEQGEVIANIPIKVTARAVFSKYVP